MLRLHEESKDKVKIIRKLLFNPKTSVIMSKTEKR